MSKDYATSIKGIAILMMLYLHLFNDPTVTSHLFSLFTVCGYSLSYILTRAAGPVEFFLILGGYGLYATYKNGHDAHRFTRIVRCYEVYWLCLLIFVPLACVFTNDNDYPGTFEHALLSVSGVETRWYWEAWFLLPYLILSALYPLLMDALDRIGTKRVLCFSFLIYFFTVIVKQRDWINIGQDSPFILLAVNSLQFLFPFYIGASFNKEQLMRRLSGSKLYGKQKCVLFLLAVVVILRTLTQTYYFIAPLYATIMISLLYLLKMKGQVYKLFKFFGRYSLYIWMVHTWLSKYLFSDFIYSFHFPIVIFLVLLLLSFIIGKLVELAIKNIHSTLGIG